MDSKDAIRDEPSRSIDRAIKEVEGKAARKRFWSLFLIGFLISLLLGVFVNFVSDRFREFSDTDYRPMDLVKMYNSLDEARKAK